MDFYGGEVIKDRVGFHNGLYRLDSKFCIFIAYRWTKSIILWGKVVIGSVWLDSVQCDFLNDARCALDFADGILKPVGINIVLVTLYWSDVAFGHLFTYSVKTMVRTSSNLERPSKIKRKCLLSEISVSRGHVNDPKCCKVKFDGWMSLYVV